jgi:hypothetical protein
MYPYQSPPGFWLRCGNLPCAGLPPHHRQRECGTGQSTFVDILPGDVAVSLNSVTLTIAG